MLHFYSLQTRLEFKWIGFILSMSIIVFQDLEIL